MPEVDDVLIERGQRYGAFIDQAEITQMLKEVMRDQSGWLGLKEDQREALEMIASKIARILNGDPDYDDNWVDIAGYASLIAKRLNGEAL